MNWSQLKWRQLNWSHSRTVVALSSQRGRGALRAPRSKLPSARASRAPNHSAHRVQHRCRRAGGVSLTAAPQPCARSHNCSCARRAPPRSNPGTICARRTQRRALLHARLRQSMPDSTSAKWSHSNALIATTCARGPSCFTTGAVAGMSSDALLCRRRAPRLRLGGRVRIHACTLLRV